MNTERKIRTSEGFTLVELLAVILIIGVVAGLVVAAAGRTTGAKERSQTTTQLAQTRTAIEVYKDSIGSLPPADNTNPSHFNPLFYELTGVTYIPSTSNPSDPTLNKYQSRFDAAHELSEAQIRNVFGATKVGFANTKDSGAFLTPSPGQIAKQTIAGSNPALGAECYLLRVPARPIDSTTQYNLWHYKVGDPNGHNPTGYDLWAELRGRKAGETITIGNWSAH